LDNTNTLRNFFSFGPSITSPAFSSLSNPGPIMSVVSRSWVYSAVDFSVEATALHGRIVDSRRCTNVNIVSWDER